MEGDDGDEFDFEVAIESWSGGGCRRETGCEYESRSGMLLFLQLLLLRMVVYHEAWNGGWKGELWDVEDEEDEEKEEGDDDDDEEKEEEEGGYLFVGGGGGDVYHHYRVRLESCDDDDDGNDMVPKGYPLLLLYPSATLITIVEGGLL